FFFQAEDGIRDRNVTGVQTCALPIFRGFHWPAENPEEVNQSIRRRAQADRQMVREAATAVAFDLDRFLQNTKHLDLAGKVHFLRSEERRVGKEWRARGAQYQ